jgi:hypothetical protein
MKIIKNAKLEGLGCEIWNSIKRAGWAQEFKLRVQNSLIKSR